MDWKTHFVIVRPNQDGTAIIVNEGSTLKDSRYWLNYIAEPFDALHITPTNPKYTGSGDPIYSCHLVSRLKSDYNETAWKKKVFSDGEKTKVTFVPATETKATSQTPISQSTQVPETQILELADGLPRKLSIDQIRAIALYNKKPLKIILTEPTKWIDWESALTLMTKEVQVLGISPDPKWPLTVSLDPKNGKGENMNYAEDMKFVVKS